MFILVRLCDASKTSRFEVSRVLKIEELRKLVTKEFGVESSMQGLYFSGKQLEDGHSLFDYGVTANNTITLMIKTLLKDTKSEVKENNDVLKNGNPQAQIEEKKGIEVENSKFYKVNDKIDICDWDGDGGFYEGKIIKITKCEESSAVLKEVPLNENSEKSSDEDAENWLKDNTNIFGQIRKDSDDGYNYYTLYDGYEDWEPSKLKIGHFRPRACAKISFENVSEGDRILANYNIEEPKKRGIFYDCTVISKSQQRTQKYLTVKIHIGLDENVLDNCKIILVNELFEIHKTTCLSKRNSKLNQLLQSNTIEKRILKPACDICNDRKSVKCKSCACKVCGGKDNPGLQLMCDECDGAYHIACHNPPLESLPNEPEWFCANCKIDRTEIVGAGEKLKTSKKKAKMPSSNNESKRDWGRGMACAGREKACTIVPTTHRGPVPGVEVGTNWMYRVQVAEAGIHRSHVGGIHGSATTGTYSIVLAGGYEDDVDNGEDFMYTGSGGRDLSGNKRTAKQSFDQQLTKYNLGLAVVCNAPVNTKKGATASDWKNGKAVRVVRAAKMKHSDYAPEEGYRYDGIYKVVKYWPEKGMSGFIVWRFLLRRDDPIPAPWTKEGRSRMKKLGLSIIYPEGYTGEKKTEGKRKSLSDEEGKNPKRSKTTDYKLPTDLEDLIKKDKANTQLWKDCLAVVSEGVIKFNETVTSSFQCICCCDVLYKPVTTPCNHNFCHTCLSRGLNVNANCPTCRHELDKSDLKINSTLREILQFIFPGYEDSRK